MISDAALADLRARNPCDQVAGKWVTLRRHGKKLIGACPICSENRTSRKATKFECDADGFVCAGCSNGGDVIKLVQLVEQIDFLAAVAWLGGVQEIDPVTAASREEERAIAKARADQTNNQFRERERGKAYDIWRRAADMPIGPVKDYLRLRGLQLPPGCRLRCISDMPYYASGSIDAAVVHRGPAMLAPIVDAAGRFRALHTTWLDLTQPNGKALIKDPETGDELPAKKVRGSKAGNAIRLVRATERPHTLMIGEGIETVLSVWLALRMDRERNKDALGIVNMIVLVGRRSRQHRRPGARDRAASDGQDRRRPRAAGTRPRSGSGLERDRYSRQRDRSGAARRRR